MFACVSAICLHWLDSRMPACICVCGLHACVHACVQTVMIPPSENRWVFVSSSIPYNEHFKEGQLQHATNILFLAVRPRKWVFIVIGPVSFTGSQGGGTSQNEECEPNFMFPIFDCSLNKWVKGRRGESQASLLGCLSFFCFCTSTYTDTRMKHASKLQTSRRLSET